MLHCMREMFRSVVLLTKPEPSINSLRERVIEWGHCCVWAACGIAADLIGTWLAAQLGAQLGS